jgi:osmotically-inducible protein OsmY
MTEVAKMRADTDTQRDVEAELRWVPDIEEKDIAVKVNAGVATLTGYVPSYSEKCRAEAAAKRVAGVLGVANDLEVRLPSAAVRSDPEIARDAVAALKSELPMSWEHVTPLVHDGHVALEGTLDWHNQRERAESAVRRVQGVLSVRNSIRLANRGTRTDIRERIEEAFRRSAALDARRISIEMDGSEITLRGEVRSWSERDQAQQAAWAAPGVLSVRNELTVRT